MAELIPYPIKNLVGLRRHHLRIVLNQKTGQSRSNYVDRTMKSLHQKYAKQGFTDQEATYLCEAYLHELRQAFLAANRGDDDQQVSRD